VGAVVLGEDGDAAGETLAVQRGCGSAVSGHVKGLLGMFTCARVGALELDMGVGFRALCGCEAVVGAGEGGGALAALRGARDAAVGEIASELVGFVGKLGGRLTAEVGDFGVAHQAGHASGIGQSEVGWLRRVERAELAVEGVGGDGSVPGAAVGIAAGPFADAGDEVGIGV